MTQQSADKALAQDLATFEAKLDQPFEGRWAWFWRNRKAERHLRQLRRTTPVVLVNYQKAGRTFRDAFAQVQQEPKRQLRQLRRQVVLASITAVFRRFGLEIFTFAAFAAVAAVIWFNLPYLADLFDRTPPAPIVAPYSQPFSGPR